MVSNYPAAAEPSPSESAVCDAESLRDPAVHADDQDSSVLEHHAQGLSARLLCLSASVTDGAAQRLIQDIARSTPQKFLRDKAKLISLPHARGGRVHLFCAGALVPKSVVYLRCAERTIFHFPLHRWPESLFAARRNLERYALELKTPLDIAPREARLIPATQSLKSWADWLGDLHRRRCKDWMDQLVRLAKMPVPRAIQADIANAIAPFLSALRESDFSAVFKLVDGIHSPDSIRERARVIRTPDPTGLDLMARLAVVQALERLPFLGQVILDDWSPRDSLDINACRPHPSGFSPAFYDKQRAEQLLQLIDSGAPLVESIAKLSGCKEWVVHRMGFMRSQNHSSPTTLQEMNSLKPETAPRSSTELENMNRVFRIAKTGRDTLFEERGLSAAVFSRAITGALASGDHRSLRYLIRESGLSELPDFLAFLSWLRSQEFPEAAQGRTLVAWAANPSLEEWRRYCTHWHRAEQRAQRVMRGEYGLQVATPEPGNAHVEIGDAAEAECGLGDSDPAAPSSAPAEAEWLPLLPSTLGSATLQYQEVINAGQLHLEARQMEHCVAGYLWQCQSSQVHIISVLKEGKPLGTVELRIECARDGQPRVHLAQAVGPRNRPLPEHIQEEVLAFARSLNQRTEILDRAKQILIRREELELQHDEEDTVIGRAGQFPVLARRNPALAVRLYLPAVRFLEERALPLLKVAADRL